MGTKNNNAVSFEIGVVYRKNGRFFLAVSNKVLMTFKDGEPNEVRPYQRYDSVRGVSVEDLCRHWGIKLSDLDAATSKYLTPSEDGLKTRPRGSRRKRAADEHAWRALRTIRVSFAG